MFLLIDLITSLIARFSRDSSTVAPTRVAPTHAIEHTLP